MRSLNGDGPLGSFRATWAGQIIKDMSGQMHFSFRVIINGRWIGTFATMRQADRFAKSYGKRGDEIEIEILFGDPTINGE